MDEMTKNAIDAVKTKRNTNPKKTTKPINDNPEIDGGIVEIIELPEMEIELNQVKLGKNKIVTIKPWTGKTKKKIRKIFEYVENPEDVDYTKIIDILIYDHIVEDIYLNAGEQQYILSILRTKSISEYLDTESICPECNKLNKFKIKDQDFIVFKENELPFKYSPTCEFIDIENNKILIDEINNYMKSEDYDEITIADDIEIAMHIKINKSVKETIDYLDNLTIKEQDKIFKSLNEKLPECDLIYNTECKECKTKVEFDIDIMNDIFESLLK